MTFALQAINALQEGSARHWGDEKKNMPLLDASKQALETVNQYVRQYHQYMGIANVEAAVEDLEEYYQATLENFEQLSQWIGKKYTELSTSSGFVAKIRP